MLYYHAQDIQTWEGQFHRWVFHFPKTSNQNRPSGPAQSRTYPDASCSRRTCTAMATSFRRHSTASHVFPSSQPLTITTTTTTIIINADLTWIGVEIVTSHTCAIKEVQLDVIDAFVGSRLTSVSTANALQHEQTLTRVQRHLRVVPLDSQLYYKSIIHVTSRDVHRTSASKHR